MIRAYLVVGEDGLPCNFDHGPYLPTWTEANEHARRISAGPAGDHVVEPVAVAEDMVPPELLPLFERVS